MLLGALTLDKMQPGALGTYSMSGAKLCKGGRCWFSYSGPQQAFGTWGRPLAKPPLSLPLEGAQLGHAKIALQNTPARGAEHHKAFLLK